MAAVLRQTRLQRQVLPPRPELNNGKTLTRCWPVGVMGRGFDVLELLMLPTSHYSGGSAKADQAPAPGFTLPMSRAQQQSFPRAGCVHFWLAAANAAAGLWVKGDTGLPLGSLI